MLKKSFVLCTTVALHFALTTTASSQCEETASAGNLAALGAAVAQSEDRSLQTVAGFNDYLAAKLREQDALTGDLLARMSVENPASFSSIYKVYLDSECISDTELAALSSSERQELLQQGQSAGSFLADVHVAMRGSRIPPVQFVRICPKDGFYGYPFGVNDPDAARKGETIQLTAWKSYWGYDPIDASEIRERWDGGELMNFPSKKIEIAWRLFGNPLGTIRSRARARFRRLEERLQAKLNEIGREATEDELREQALDLVSQHVNANYRSHEDAPPLSETAVETIQKLNREGLVKLIDTWQTFVEDERNVEGSRAAVARVVSDQEANVNRVNIGLLLVVTNHKDINVQSHFTVGSQFDQYVTRRSRKVGLTDFNVSTIVIDLSDNINVETELLWSKVESAGNESKVLGTAGLEAALKRLEQSGDRYFAAN